MRVPPGVAADTATAGIVKALRIQMSGVASIEYFDTHLPELILRVAFGSL
jgi:hypothetical protein